MVLLTLSPQSASDPHLPGLPSHGPLAFTETVMLNAMCLSYAGKGHEKNNYHCRNSRRGVVCGIRVQYHHVKGDQGYRKFINKKVVILV